MTKKEKIKLNEIIKALDADYMQSLRLKNDPTITHPETYALTHLQIQVVSRMRELKNLGYKAGWHIIEELGNETTKLS